MPPPLGPLPGGATATGAGAGTAASGGLGFAPEGFDNLLTAQYYSGNTQTQTQQNQTGAQNQNNMNAYTDAQRALQGQALGGYQGLLQGGQIPTNFGVPQNVIDQYVANYNKYVAPNRAYQYGEGSPTISTGLQEGLANLLAQGSQNQLSNYMGAINGAAATAFNPVGQSQNQTSLTGMTGDQNTHQSGYQVNADAGGLLARLVGMFL
jgi:hypothetical protein